jgi:hypothetical protein
LRIGASGLRSSWASVARNSSLRRSASRSSCAERSSPWWARTRSLTSLKYTATPPLFTGAAPICIHMS